MRWALGVEYLGTAYHGWQRQAHAASVQACVESALSAVAKTPIEVVCAGRTDAGVHALEQVVHFDCEVERPEKAWVLGVNSHLPADIRVRWAKCVSEDFHARFSATSRRYRYWVDNRLVRSAIWSKQMTWHRYPLDAGKMHEAGQYLLGERDFSAFRGAGCQSKTPMRCVTELVVVREGDHIKLEIEANAFLYHMVRNIVGVLLPIGEGLQPVEWAKTVLETRDRCCAGVTAPPEGLYLLSVQYPDEDMLYSSKGCPIKN